jgi:hypothetical protein
MGIQQVSRMDWTVWRQFPLPNRCEEGRDVRVPIELDLPHPLKVEDVWAQVVAQVQPGHHLLANAGPGHHRGQGVDGVAACAVLCSEAEGNVQNLE